MRNPRPCRARPLARTTALAACAALWICSASGAQGVDNFSAVGPPFMVNAATGFNQYWSRVDISADGARLGFSFSSGQDPRARQFSIGAAPLTGDLWCNPLYTTYIQDEAETCFSNDGYQLVAWSERNGHDGEQMGIFGNIISPSGVPAAAEFQINQIWQASQWRPLIVRRPTGGWIVAWTGDWDGDSLFRIVNTDGSFVTDDIKVNTFDNGAQVDTAPAVTDNGRMLMVFVDFSGAFGVGTGTNLWGRLYAPNGTPLQVAPFPLLSGVDAAGDQREPRVAADGLGRYVVVWEDAAREGFTWGIYAQVYDNDGTLLTPQPIHINTTVIGAQRSPRVAADALGNFVVCWEDWSTATADVRAQRFDANFQPVGVEFLVNTDLVGDQRRPSLAMHATSGHVVMTWEGPGISTDVFGRIYTTYNAPQTFCTAKVNGLGCTPAITWSGTPSLGGADDFHVGAQNVLNNRNGLLFLGFAPAAAPFYGGTLCVQPPVVRAGVQNAGGSVGVDDCSGGYDAHLTHSWMLSKGLTVGTSAYCQYWTRDPLSPQPVGLTNGLSFDVRP